MSNQQLQIHIRYNSINGCMLHVSQFYNCSVSVTSSSAAILNKPQSKFTGNFVQQKKLIFLWSGFLS